MTRNLIPRRTLAALALSTISLSTLALSPLPATAQTIAIGNTVVVDHAAGTVTTRHGTRPGTLWNMPRFGNIPGMDRFPTRAPLPHSTSLETLLDGPVPETAITKPDAPLSCATGLEILLHDLFGMGIPDCPAVQPHPGRALDDHRILDVVRSALSGQYRVRIIGLTD